MSEQEGVIKFDLSFNPAQPELDHDYSDLNHWQQIFKQTKILGQDDNRYYGLGFGNLSQRLSDDSFLISGTQTGMLDRLEPEHYARVLSVDLTANRVRAQGSIKPSSESLTHAAIYQLDHDIEFVFHIHSPDIWKNRKALSLPETAADIPYGTTEMALAVRRLSDAGAFRQQGILAMAGHEDGIISFAETASPAGQVILDRLSLARHL
jgi:hypothetical protein